MSNHPGFGWNSRGIEVGRKLPQGGVQRVRATPKEIVQQPSGYELESVIYALCLCVGEMIDMHEAQAQVLQNMQSMRQLGGKEPVEKPSEEEG